MKFFFDKDIEEIITHNVNDLMDIQNIPTLEFGKNTFWQMITSNKEEDMIKNAKSFFKSTFVNLYNSDYTATVIRFEWKMSYIYTPENVLVFFLFSPDELKKKLNSIFKMKAFW